MLSPDRPPTAKPSVRFPLVDATKRTTADSATTAANSGWPGSKAAGYLSSTCTVIQRNRDMVKTIDNFAEATGGAIGPHGAYALPGRVLIPCLSNEKDHGGRTALVEYSNDGNYIATHWLPTKDDPRGATNANLADGYGYDARVLPRKNALLTSSFTGRNNYMMDFGEIDRRRRGDETFWVNHGYVGFPCASAQKSFRSTGCAAGDPLGLGRQTQLRLHCVRADIQTLAGLSGRRGEWQAKEIATIGDVKGGVLPVDISLSADDKTLFVDCFGDGKCRVFDVSDPQKPKQIYEKQIGRQVNMVSQSWDGKRLYFTSSLLANWDKKGEDNEQFLRAYTWNGKELKPKFRSRFHRVEARAAPSHAFRRDKTRCESRRITSIGRCDEHESSSSAGTGAYVLFV